MANQTCTLNRQSLRVGHTANAEIFEKAIDSIEKPNCAANTFIGFIAENELNGQILTEWL